MPFAATADEQLVLERDLASIASLAALELDQLSLGRLGQLDAVGRLVEAISTAVTTTHEATSPSSLFNPTVAIAIGRAVDDASSPEGVRSTQLPELLSRARTYEQRLRAVAASPLVTDRNEVRALRDFCVAVARQAAAIDRYSPYTIANQHPFRKYTQLF